MADWRKIKTEYITTDTSYRDLCKKHNVAYSTLSRKAKAEHWPELRTQNESKLTSKVVDKVIDQQVESAKLMHSTASTLLRMIAEGLGTYDPDTLLADRQALRGITGALKDLKDVLSLKSDTDLEEQKARIAKLRKEVEDETPDTKTEISFSDGNVKEWSE